MNKVSRLEDILGHGSNIDSIEVEYNSENNAIPEIITKEMEKNVENCEDCNNPDCKC